MECLTSKTASGKKGNNESAANPIRKSVVSRKCQRWYILPVHIYQKSL